MPRKRPTFVVIDDFLDDPHQLRDLALRFDFIADLNHYKGRRTLPYRDPAIRVVFENVLDAPIVDWDNQPYNGSFQRTGPDDPIVWHADTQTYAAAIYLDPGCDPEAGTSFWRHRDTTAGGRRGIRVSMSVSTRSPRRTRTRPSSTSTTSCTPTRGNWSTASRRSSTVA